MSELDDIKARAAELPDLYPTSSPQGLQIRQLKADLDRAITIADRAEIAGYAFYGHDKDSLVVQLREARADAVRWKGMYEVLSDRRDELIGQVGEARAEVERLTNLRSTQALQRREQDVKDFAAELKKARDVVLKLRDDWLRIAKLNPIRKEQVGQGPMDDVCRFCGGVAPYTPNAEVEHKDCVWALAQRRVADTESYEAFRQA